MDICTPLGNVKRHILSKNHLLNIPSLYSAVRKTTWGGLHPITATATREEKDSLGISKIDMVVEESSPLCKLNTTQNGSAVVSMDDEDDDEAEEFELSTRSSSRKSSRGADRDRNKLKMLSPFAMSSLKNKKKDEDMEMYGETMTESSSGSLAGQDGHSVSLQELMATGKLHDMLSDDDDEIELELEEKKNKPVGRKKSNRTGVLAKRRK